MACTVTDYNQDTSEHDRTTILRLANLRHWWVGNFTVADAGGIVVCKVAMTFHTRTNVAPPVPDTFHVEIYSNNAVPAPDEPNAVVANGVSDSVSFSGIPIGAAETEIEFPWSGAKPTLATGTIYWVVCKPDWALNNANHCTARYGTEAGHLFGSRDTTGGNWNILSQNDGPVMKVYKETAAGAVMAQIQKNNLGADLYNGTMISGGSA